MRDRLRVILNDALAKAGQKVTDQEAQTLLNGFQELVEKKYSYMEFKDIEIAIANGLSGDYGEFYKITYVEIAKWLGIRWKNVTAKYLRSENYHSDNIHVDLAHTPMGSALNFKIKYLNTDDWDKIETRELAIILKNKDLDEAKRHCKSLGIEIRKEQNKLHN